MSTDCSRDAISARGENSAPRRGPRVLLCDEMADSVRVLFVQLGGFVELVSTKDFDDPAFANLPAFEREVINAGISAVRSRNGGSHDA